MPVEVLFFIKVAVVLLQYCMAKHWNKLPGEAISASKSRGAKRCVNMALRNMVHSYNLVSQVDSRTAAQRLFYDSWLKESSNCIFCVVRINLDISSDSYRKHLKAT